MKKVKFKDLEIGDKFSCWGDTHLNYNYPAWCKCIKIDHHTAQEINGIRFLISESDEVIIE